MLSSPTSAALTKEESTNLESSSINRFKSINIFGFWILKPCVQHYEIKGIRQSHISRGLTEEEIRVMGLRLGFSGLDYNTPELDVLWENRRWVWLPSVTSFLPFLLFLLLQTQELPIPAPDPIPLSNWGLFFSAAKFLAFWGSFYDIWGQIVFVVGLGGGTAGYLVVLVASTHQMPVSHPTSFPI